MSNKLLNENEYKELKSLLPHGSFTKIAKEVGITTTNVRLVLKGKWYNAKVYTVAMRMAEAEKLRKQKIAEKLKAIVS